MTISKLLHSNVKHWVEVIEGAIDYDETDGYEDIFDYLAQSFLDITYTVSGDGRLLGAEVLVAFGGPTIYINTMRGAVEGFWGTERLSMSYNDTIGLEDWIIESNPINLTP